MSKTANIKKIVYFSIKFVAGSLTVSAPHYSKGTGKRESRAHSCSVPSGCYQAHHEFFGSFDSLETSQYHTLFTNKLVLLLDPHKP